MDGIATAMVEFAANGGNAPGYLARPEDVDPVPGVVVIQEWWGLDSHIKDVTERFAREGFVALAPDLYRGQVAAEPDEARKLAMELQHEQAIKDIQGAVNNLIELPFVTPKRVGVIGFCMGGGLASLMSFRGTNVGAVAVFYGGRSGLMDEDAAAVSAPYLGIYGAEDSGIPQELVRQNERLLAAHNKIHEIVVYPDAPHAFFNDQRASYRLEAAEDAWKRTLAWFREHLQP